MVGFYDVPMDTIFQGILQVDVPEIPLAPMETLRRKSKEATMPLHHNCPGMRTAMADLLLTLCTTNNRSWSWVGPLNVLELRLLALVLALEGK